MRHNRRYPSAHVGHEKAGRLKEGGAPDAPRYDLASVLSMQAEDLIREMFEEAGDKDPKLREKIETLAMLQYQRGRGAAEVAGDREMLQSTEGLMRRLEKVNEDAERRATETGRIAGEFRKMNADAERHLEELRAMDEGRLRRGPFGERGTG